MRLSSHHGTWVIAMTFVVALMLTIFPLPGWAEAARPEWVSMVLIYWVMALPERIGVGVAWVMGLLLDVLHGALLGQYAMALVLVALAIHSIHQRVRVYPVWQQGLVVGFLVALQLIPVIWVRGIIGQAPDSWLFWLPTVTSMLLWPAVFLILRDLRRRFWVS